MCISLFVSRAIPLRLQVGLELPFSCYKKLVRVSAHVAYIQYFPLELTNKDYMRRLFEIVGFGIKEKVLHMWHTGTFGGNHNDIMQQFAI